MSHWKRKKAVWALETESGELLCGFRYEPRLFPMKADAVAVFKAFRTSLKLARIDGEPMSPRKWPAEEIKRIVKLRHSSTEGTDK